MAKIKFGMMMTDARGKLGGQVFSKNRSGSYVRTKVTPVNPRTESQQANRSLLGNISAGWSFLNDDQRNAWNAAVESWQKTNVFGDLVKPSGKNLFTSLNKVRLALFPALAIQNNPPAKVVFPAVYAVSGTADRSSATFTVTMSNESAVGSAFEVRATPPVSPGTNYVNNLLRGLGTAFVGGAGGVISFGAEYIAKFGALQVGQKIFVEVTSVSDTGQRGVPSMISVIVVE